MRKGTLRFTPTNRVLRTYKNFPYKPWYAIAELVDNSTQSFAWNRDVLNASYGPEGTLEVRIDYDRKRRILSVWDNAMGMSQDELQHGILLANPPSDTSGRSEFGMGMKTACSWLGRTWSVETKRLGETERFRLQLDVEAVGTADGSEDLDLEIYEGEAPEAHYTLIEIRDMYHSFRGRRLGKIKEYLVSMYREDIREGRLVLKWDGAPLDAPEVKPLVVTLPDGTTRTWQRQISFDVDGRSVRGYACILGDGYRGRARAGFDLLRRGRVIVGRPGGYRPEGIFGESRNDTKNQRLYGELHLDEFPVNHLKDDFLWDEFQESFDDSLEKECADILAYLKDFRVRGDEGITPDTRDLADDAVVDELSSDDMVNLITFLAQSNPPTPPSDAQTEAEAEALRETASTEKEVRSGRFTIRIYHLGDAAPERKYVTFASVDSDQIDVFINDNHPFIQREISDTPKAYEAYVKGALYDALAEWLARKIPNLHPHTISHFKDQLMRGPGLEPA